MSPKEAFEFLQRRHRVVETEGDVENEAWKVLKAATKEEEIKSPCEHLHTKIQIGNITSGFICEDCGEEV